MPSAKQVVAERFGGPEVLKVVDAAIPSPNNGQILVKVEAAGVLYGDIMRRKDRYITPTALPYAPGTEIAGTVVDVGEDVTFWKQGDRVLSRVGSHGYAQYAVADAIHAIALPERIGFGEATALLAQGLTAYLLTHEVTALKGKSTFIESAAGGVGMQMVQLARAQGASLVVASASSEEKRESVRRNGVDLVIDPAEQRWSEKVLGSTGGRGIDVAYESSGACFTELLKCLAPFGTIVKFGRGIDEHQSLDPSQLVGKNQVVRGFYLPGYFDTTHLPRIGDATRSLIAATLSGELKIEISHRFSLDQAELAHREIEARQTTGKVVLEPWSV